MPFRVLAQPIYTMYVRVRFFSADMTCHVLNEEFWYRVHVSHASERIFHQSGHLTSFSSLPTWQSATQYYFLLLFVSKALEKHCGKRWNCSKLLNFTFLHNVFYLFNIFNSFNPFPNKPWFLRVCRTSLLKTLWEKEKLLVTSNFSFSHSVSYSFGELSAIFIKSKIVVCKLFQFGRV